MARLLYGTSNISDTGTAAQFSSDTAGRVLVFAAHSRMNNNGYVFIGSDSNVSSGAGWELAANEEITWNYKTYEAATAIPPSDHWMTAQSTAMKVDWWMLMEN